MARIAVCHWRNPTMLKEYGYEHDETVEADLSSLIDHFLNHGLKVMIEKPSSLLFCDYIMYVDNYRFQQR